MQGPQETTYLKGDNASRIVILPVNGLINDATANAIHESLDALRANPPKAVILRVDSGGGGVAAADRIWHEIKQFKADLKIPIVASFGSMAASGGYYISMNCDYIYAEPTTITGSVGVIAEAFTVQDLLKKVGVTPEVIIATKATKKDSLSPFRAWTDRDRSELRGILDNAYVRFVNIVAEGRSKVLTHEQVETLATGEPFTTTQAIDNKLVDAEGYMDAAIAKAKELAGLSATSKPQVNMLSPRKGFSLLRLVGMGKSDVPVSGQMFSSEHLRQLAGELAMPRIEYTATLH
jgi:protease-4